MNSPGVVRKRPLAALAAAALFVITCLLAAAFLEESELDARFAQARPGALEAPLDGPPAP